MLRIKMTPLSKIMFTCVWFMAIYPGCKLTDTVSVNHDQDKQSTADPNISQNWAVLKFTGQNKGQAGMLVLMTDHRLSNYNILQQGLYFRDSSELALLLNKKNIKQHSIIRKSSIVLDLESTDYPIFTDYPNIDFDVSNIDSSYYERTYKLYGNVLLLLFRDQGDGMAGLVLGLGEALPPTVVTDIDKAFKTGIFIHDLNDFSLLERQENKRIFVGPTPDWLLKNDADQISPFSPISEDTLNSIDEKANKNL